MAEPAQQPVPFRKRPLIRYRPERRERERQHQLRLPRPARCHAAGRSRRSTARPECQLAWQHAFDEPSDDSALNLAGYDSFTVKGVPLAEDSALAQVDLGLPLALQASVELGYSGQIGDGNSDHGVRLGLNIAL